MHWPGAAKWESVAEGVAADCFNFSSTVWFADPRIWSCSDTCMISALGIFLGLDKCSRPPAGHPISWAEQVQPAVVLMDSADIHIGGLGGKIYGFGVGKITSKEMCWTSASSCLGLLTSFVKQSTAFGASGCQPLNHLLSSLAWSMDWPTDLLQPGGFLEVRLLFTQIVDPRDFFFP